MGHRSQGHRAACDGAACPGLQRSSGRCGKRRDGHILVRKGPPGAWAGQEPRQGRAAPRPAAVGEHSILARSTSRGPVGEGGTGRHWTRPTTSQDVVQTAQPPGLTQAGERLFRARGTPKKGALRDSRAAQDARAPHPVSSMSHRETCPLIHICSPDGLQTPVLLFYQGVRNWGKDVMAGQVWGPPYPTQRRYGGVFT